MKPQALGQQAMALAQYLQSDMVWLGDDDPEFKSLKNDLYEINEILQMLDQCLSEITPDVGEHEEVIGDKSKALTQNILSLSDGINATGYMGAEGVSCGERELGSIGACLGRYIWGLSCERLKKRLTILVKISHNTEISTS